MPVHPDFAAYTLEQLGRLVPQVRSRSMFGGVSISGPEGAFALIDNDVVYLKGGAGSRALFESAGWPAFEPFGDGATMAYFAVPGELLDDPEALRPWVELAVAAAGLVRKKKRKTS